MSQTLSAVAPDPRRESRRAHAAMLLFAALIAGSFSLGGLAAPHIAPETLTAMRFLLAVAVMAGVCLAGPGLERRWFRGLWRYAILGGLLAIYFVLMFVALRITDPIGTSAVFTLTPILSAIFGWFLLRQATTPRMAAALALAGGGAVWVIFRADIDAILGFDIGRGEAVFFVGCACHALYPPLVRVFNRGEPVPVFTLGMLSASLVLVTIYALATGAIAATHWGALPPIVWITAAYLGIATTALTTALVQYSSLRLPAAKVMAYGYLVPSFVIVWEFLFGHGLAAGPVLLGVAATVVAMAMLLKD